jgi:hypothetical protein
VPNPFLPIWEPHLANTKEEFNKLKKFIDRYNTPVAIYARVIRGIDSDLRKKSDKKVKANLYLLKYEFFRAFLLEERRFQFRKEKEGTPPQLTPMEQIDMLASEAVKEMARLRIGASAELPIDPDALEWLLAHSKTETLSLPASNDPELNARLVPKYQNVLAGFCEFNHLMGADRPISFKLMRRDICLGLIIQLENEGKSVVMRTIKVCLICILKRLKTKSNVLPSFHGGQTCDYEDETKKPLMALGRHSVNRILELTFLFQSDDQSSCQIYSDVLRSKSKSFTSESNYEFSLLSIIERYKQAQEVAPVLVETLRQVYSGIFDRILTALFNVDNCQTHTPSEPYLSFKNQSRAPPSSAEMFFGSGHGSTARIIDISFREFITFISLNFEQLKIIRLQLVVRGAKLTRYVTSGADFFKILSEIDPKNKVSFKIEEFVPKLGKVEGHFGPEDQTFIKTYKMSDAREGDFNSTVAVAVQFKKEFMKKFREKTESSFFTIFTSFFASLFFELFFIQPFYVMHQSLSDNDLSEKADTPRQRLTIQFPSQMPAPRASGFVGSNQQLPNTSPGVNEIEG